MQRLRWKTILGRMDQRSKKATTLALSSVEWDDLNWYGEKMPKSSSLNGGSPRMALFASNLHRNGLLSMLDVSHVTFWNHRALTHTHTHTHTPLLFYIARTCIGKCYSCTKKRKWLTLAILKINVGQVLGSAVALITITSLLRRYEFKLVPDQEITYQVALTLPMKNGMNVYVNRRLWSLPASFTYSLHSLLLLLFIPEW